MSILSKIQTGKIGRAQKIVIYAPEGLGKSTLAAQFPDPLFLDIEGGTSQLEVARVGRESLPTLAAVEQALAEILFAKPCKTLVIDTADWLEEMAISALCMELKIDAIESNDKGSPVAFGRGIGTYLPNKFTILLAQFDRLIAAGINVVLLAHSTVKRHEPPDGVGAYDRYELKLKKQTAALVKEWCDILCFANYRTQIREKGKGESGEKLKGVGGKERVLNFAHCAAWDAKNRHGLADAEPWGKDAAEAFKVFKRALDFSGATTSPTPAQPEKVAAIQQPEPVKTLPEGVKDAGEVAAQIVAELKPDEIPMHFDEAGKGIVSPEEIEFHRLCEPYEAAVNAFLLAGKRIQAGRTFRDATADYRARVLKNPAGFLKAALAGGAK